MLASATQRGFFVKVCEQEHQGSEIDAAYPSVGCSTVAVSWAGRDPNLSLFRHVLPANRYITTEPTRGLKNRLPLLQLRVIGQVLLGFAGACKSRIFKGFFCAALLRVAPYCARGGVRVVSNSLVSNGFRTYGARIPGFAARCPATTTASLTTSARSIRRRPPLASLRPGPQGRERRRSDRPQYCDASASDIGVCVGSWDR